MKVTEGDGHRVALIAGSPSQMQRAQPACGLYRGRFFRRALAYVRQAGYDSIYILTAHRGLVGVDEIVESSNLSLYWFTVAERRAWSRRVAQKLGALVPPPAWVDIFAGERYRQFIVKLLEQDGYAVCAPLAVLRAGRQIARLNEWLAEMGQAESQTLAVMAKVEALCGPDTLSGLSAT